MSSEEMNWKVIKPNKEGDWINQRNEAFEFMIPLGDKKGKSDKTAFKPIYSAGVKTNRDMWCLASSRSALESNMKKTSDFYHSELQRLTDLDLLASAREEVTYDSKQITWTRELLSSLTASSLLPLSNHAYRMALYRPFFKQHLLPHLEQLCLPNTSSSESDSKNLVTTSGPGAGKDWSVPD